jgi:acyl-coenzyme A thioesterase PaaI-like protein
VAVNPEVTAENVAGWLPGTFPGDMAIEPVEITDEVATGRMVVDGRHLHPGGFVHGGIWTAFGDSVAAWATFRNLPAQPRLHDDRAEAERVRRQWVR